MPQRKQSSCIYILGLMALFLLILCQNADADTVYLNNGNALEGIIKMENENEIEIEVCFGGSVKLERSSIKRIERSSQQEAAWLRSKWEREKKEFEGRLRQQKLTEEQEPKSIEFSDENRSIVVEVILNKKVKAALVLDTGSSVVMLRRSVAGKLGIDVDNLAGDTKLAVVDGRKIEAKRIVLESIQLEDLEATNVEAVVLLEETQDENIKDGLLGMSFLSKFIFKIDHKEKKVILEKF